MPSKKKKYNARFPAGRIKKIMQSDEEIGKVAQAVPVIISRTLELFVESLLTKTLKITNTRNAKTLSPTHLKQCIMAEQRFDFLRELVKNLPDISLADEAAANYDDVESSPEQDSFSDPAMDTHQQQATTSISHTNGQMDESKLRRTRSIQQQFDLQQQNQQQQHEILERIQKSMHHHKLLRTESTPNADTNCSAPKRARQTATTTTATTSTIAGKCKQTEPIVHVQIDYGNIPWKLKNDKSVPLSAPAQIVQPVFDFSQMGSNQTPISISIDLSSINKNNSTMTSTATTTTSAINSQAAKPKATTITTTTSPPPIRTSPLEKSNTLLELDEDYDDI